MHRFIIFMFSRPAAASSLRQRPRGQGSVALALMRTMNALSSAESFPSACLRLTPFPDGRAVVVAVLPLSMSTSSSSSLLLLLLLSSAVGRSFFSKTNDFAKNGGTYAALSSRLEPAAANQEKTGNYTVFSRKLVANQRDRTWNQRRTESGQSFGDSSIDITCRSGG